MTHNGTDDPLDFVREIVEADIEKGTYGGRVHTRFPPEPSGYLHIGHSKAIVLNFSIAEEYDGRCNLRFDDTNPIAEETHYVEAMKEDIRWLGYDWADREFFASDYFDQLYEFAVDLIKKGKAYVDSLGPEQIREYRGSWNEPGKDSPYRDRSVEENLELFEQMKNGEFAEGEAVLRAKIDMGAANMNMRDPILYRILHSEHHRTGDAWCIYPTYDMAHGQGDSIEGITHSLCSLEFENHRPLYDWLLEQLEIHHPKQIEFARLNISYTVTSKRKLRELVEKGFVSDWDDPRMPTLRGMRRRGFPPAAIRNFCHQIGVAKKNSVHEMGMLEECVRDVLNQEAPRRMGVLRPLKLVIENYPDDDVEHLEAVNNPEDESAGHRNIPFSRELYIEQDDFMEDPPKKFFRLAPGREVRLRYGYFVTCTDVVKDDDDGHVVEVRCTYDPETRGGYAPDGRKVKATLHWVSAPHATRVEARLYDRLFNREDPTDVEEGEDWTEGLNPESLETVHDCYAEPSVQELPVGETIQFERLGYFRVDEDSSDDRVVLNRAVTLKDQWAKLQMEERKAKKRREKEREKERQRQMQKGKQDSNS